MKWEILLAGNASVYISKDVHLDVGVLRFHDQEGVFHITNREFHAKRIEEVPSSTGDSAGSPPAKVGPGPFCTEWGCAEPTYLFRCSLCHRTVCLEHSSSCDMGGGKDRICGNCVAKP